MDYDTYGSGAVDDGVVPSLRQRVDEAFRARTSLSEKEIPVEWWGLERPWDPKDEEVLDRAIATRG